MRWSLAVVSVLVLSACVPADGALPEGFEMHTLISNRDREPATFACAEGADSEARAIASLRVIDAGFTRLEAEIQARTQADNNGGPTFGSSELFRLSSQTGDQLARQIEADHGCYLWE